MVLIVVRQEGKEAIIQDDFGSEESGPELDHFFEFVGLKDNVCQLVGADDLFRYDWCHCVDKGIAVFEKLGMNQGLDTEQCAPVDL